MERNGPGWESRALRGRGTGQRGERCAGAKRTLAAYWSARASCNLLSFFSASCDGSTADGEERML